MLKNIRKPKRAAQPTAEALSWRPWLCAAGLVLLVAVVYWPAADYPFVWDDDTNVEHNLALRSLGGLYDIWFNLGSVPQYYPLVQTTFWLEYHAWRLDPSGYHVVNFLLHAIAAVLAWRLFERLAVPGAWLAAAIFAVHPVCVESVAWVTERKNVLSCALALGSVLTYLRFSPPEMPDEAQVQPAGKRWGTYAVSLLLYIAALLAKTATASLPAVLLVIFWWKRGRLTWREVACTAPFFAVGLPLSALTVLVETTHVGATGIEWDLSGVDRLLLAGRALWFYAGKLVWPYPLSFIYPRWVIDSRVWWQYLYPAAAVALIVALWLARGRVGRGPLAAVLIFAGVLVPALGFFNIYMYRFSFVADHLQYHASIALIALVAAGLVLAAKRAGKPRQWAAPLLGVALLLPLGLLARQTVYAYRSPRVLYEDIVAHNPDCWLAHSLLKSYWQRQGKPRQVLESARNEVAAYDRVLQADPKYIAAHRGRGDAYVSLGRRAEAIADYEAALQIQPELGEVKNNLAWLLATSSDARLRDGQRAVELAKEACQQRGYQEPSRLSTLAAAYAEIGDFQRAIAWSEKSIELSGDKPADQWKRELESYRSGQPWRDSPSEP